VRYYGATDVPLSRVGEAQMRHAAAALAGERFDAVYASCLQRSRRGAALVAGERHVPTAVAAFDEVDFGDWEGWTREEIATRAPQEFGRWQADPEHFVYPGGECRQAFRRRVVAEVLAGAPGERVLVVVHRGVIAVALAELLGLGAGDRRSLEIDLGSIHVLNREGGGWRAERLNAVDHLVAAAVSA
jgi:alpha-ribazole phosphatase